MVLSMATWTKTKVKILLISGTWKKTFSTLTLKLLRKFAYSWVGTHQPLQKHKALKNTSTLNVETWSENAILSMPAVFRWLPPILNWEFASGLSASATSQSMVYKNSRQVPKPLQPPTCMSCIRTILTPSSVLWDCLRAQRVSSCTKSSSLMSPNFLKNGQLSDTNKL